MTFYAHSLEGHDPEKWETMREHEDRVAELCSKFLGRIHPSLAPWGELLGRWHDLGKYHPAFQSKIRGSNSQIEHAGAGARLAIENAPELGVAAAFAIAGHHTGLANSHANAVGFDPIKRLTLADRIHSNKTILDSIRNSLPPDLSTLTVPILPKWIGSTKSNSNFRSLELLIRVMFSALVDADRIATGNFYSIAEGRKPRSQQLVYDSIETLRDRVDSYIDNLTRSASKQPTPVNEFRKIVLDACRSGATRPPGLFSLTVPTGGGKTLSAISFALNHAVKHGLRRVIIVIPYTSIIRQNANEYRKALAINGEPDLFNIVEHHSGIDEQKAMTESHESNEAEIRRRIAVENWDAPIVITTSVQFFESIFTDHPSKARKLHRIANSVVVLDEVQTLPPNLLLPILDGIKELTANYKTSFVLSTATPPALAKRDDFPDGLLDIWPLIKDPEALASSTAARRVTVEWRVDREVGFKEIATEITRGNAQQTLTVVHKRKDARILAELLPKNDRVHLSAQMCPAHRIAAISEMTRRLANDEPCLAVSTQLIEAGVNIDFPVVYRALSGVDSLTQAAGRCDREGKRTLAAGKPAGKLIVFLAETLPPGETLKKALSTTLSLFIQKQHESLTLDIFNPKHCVEFFSQFYQTNALDSKNIQRERASLNFANVGRAFEMIESSWSFPVVVPWPLDGPQAGEGKRRAELFREDPCRETSRGLQPYIVQIPKPAALDMAREGVIEIWEDSIGLPYNMFNSTWYSEEFGITIENCSMIDPENPTV